MVLAPQVEEWRPVLGYELAYQVSNHGQVRGVPRVCAHSWNGGQRAVPGKVLTHQVDKKGRHYVQLCLDGKVRRKAVHVLVLEAWKGPRPKPEMDACHDNGRAGDNWPENLRWDTRASNITDQVRHGTHHQARKTLCPAAHLLVLPNLVAAELRRGGRACLACQRARDDVRNGARAGRVVDLDTRRQHHYTRIMGEAVA